MRISLSEIWNFIEMIEKQESGWHYALYAGKVQIPNIDHEVSLIPTGKS